MKFIPEHPDKGTAERRITVRTRLSAVSIGSFLLPILGNLYQNSAELSTQREFAAGGLMLSGAAIIFPVVAEIMERWGDGNTGGGWCRRGPDEPTPDPTPLDWIVEVEKYANSKQPVGV